MTTPARTTAPTPGGSPPVERPRRFRLRTTASALGAVALVAAACGGDDGAETATETEAVASETSEPLTLGFVVDPSWAQVPVAVDLGLFEDVGVDVEVISFPTGAEALEALNGGSIDVATAGETPTSAAIIANEDIRVIADGSRHPESRFVTSAASGITTLEGLEGARIATPLGSSAHYFASMFLDQADVDAELVQVSPPEMGTALDRGDVEVVAVFQPHATNVTVMLGDDAVTITGDPPYVQHSLYITLADTVAQRSEDMAGLLSALSLADELLSSEDPDALAAIGAVTNLEGDTLQSVVGEFIYEVQLEDALADELAERAAWGIRIGNLSDDTEVPDYLDHLDRGPLEASS